MGDEKISGCAAESSLCSHRTMAVREDGKRRPGLQWRRHGWRRRERRNERRKLTRYLSEAVFRVVTPRRRSCHLLGPRQWDVLKCNTKPSDRVKLTCGRSRGPQGKTLRIRTWCRCAGRLSREPQGVCVSTRRCGGRVLSESHGLRRAKAGMGWGVLTLDSAGWNRRTLQGAATGSADSPPR